MKSEDFYHAASARLFTPEQLDTIAYRYQQSAALYPEEHERVARYIQDHKLVGHREVLEHYLRSNLPMSDHALNVINAFADSTAAGAYDRGAERGAPTHGFETYGGVESAASRLFTSTVKPDEGER